MIGLNRRRVMVGGKKDIDYSQEYLTFVALENGTFSLSGNDVYYSINKGATWSLLAAGTQSPTIARGKSIMWKGELTPTSGSGVGTFSSTGMFDAQGNAMSLLYGDDFKEKALKNYAFAYLLRNSKIINAVNVSLPTKTLTGSCYRAMFYNCISLVSVPELPATALNAHCYRAMFHGCISLVSVPELPAKTLNSYCYYQMFYNCPSLVSAPELPATTLKANCYGAMFSGCTSLNYIKCLATNLSASGSLTNWVLNVSTTGTFVKDSSTTWVTGVDGIPEGWTIESA